MASVNKVILVGYLGADPDVRTTGSGTTVAELRLATSFGKGDKEQTEWHRIILWEKLADIAAQYLTKGKQVYVEGRIQTRSYDDKDGVKRYVTEIVGQNLTMLGSKGEASDEAATEPAKPAPRPTRARKVKPEPEIADEDIFA